MRPGDPGEGGAELGRLRETYRRVLPLVRQGLRQAANVEKDRERLMKIEGREFVPQPKQFHVPELGEVGKAGNLKKEIEKGKDRAKEKDKGMER